MKIKLCVLIFILTATWARAQTNDLTSLLQQGLLEEQANRNLDAAIADYQSLALQFDKNRQIAATAIFRLGECYRMQGQTNEAAAQYQRVLSDFSDQQILATMSRQNLTGMGFAQSDNGKTPIASSATSSEADLLAAQLSGIDNLKSDLAEQARAVQAIFPDDNLKKMLLQLPKVQAQESELKADPQLLTYPQFVQINGYSIAVGNVNSAGVEMNMESHSTNLLADAEWELNKQMTWIKQRVDFILSIQKARLKVLQTTVGADANGGLPSDIALWNKLKDLPRPEVEKVLPTLIPDSALLNLIQQRDEARVKLASLAVYYSTNNPNSVSQQALADSLQKQIDDRVDGIMGALEIRAVIAQNRTLPGGFTAINSSDAEDQEIQRIQTMIRNSPDLINAAGGDGNTPLAKAAANGWLKVATYLLDHGADVNNRSGTMPLVAAAAAGNKAMTQFLLDHGADVNAKNNDGKTPLTISAERSFPAVMEVLLANKADINALENWGRTPLMWAAWQQRNGSEKIMAMLLEHKPEVNTQDQSGATALMNAAVVGSLENVKALLAAGADPNLINNDGRTALSYVAEKNSPELVKMLLDAKADPNVGTLDLPLLGAIHNKDAASAELLLLQAGANPNVFGKVSWVVTINGQTYGEAFGKSVTPLYLATSTKQFPLVQLLLKYKADPNDTQTDERPLLFIALSDTNILEALLDAGAKANVLDTGSNPWTLLDYAVYQNNASAVDVLLKHDANPDLSNPSGSTPLHYAASNLASSNVFQLLLAYKANPNVRDHNGNTPLSALKLRAAGNFSNITSERKIQAGQLADLLRQHGALDKLPDWDHITVSRPSANYSWPKFTKSTNDWNQFTLLDLMVDLYAPQSEMEINNGMAIRHRLNHMFYTTLPFPDLSRITIVRPSHDSTNETRIKINLLNGTNGVDCAKDVRLQFGDVVEIPEYTHALAVAPVGLDDSQTDIINNYTTGKAELTSQGQKIEISFRAYDDLSKIGAVLNRPDAQKILQSSSDLSRVKVTRRDPQTGKTQSWIVDCSDSKNPPDLRVRNGDVIDVPGK